MSPAGLQCPVIADPFASQLRPALTGVLGAVSAAHPLAVAAGQEMLVQGGSAVDAAIAAQAVLCVVAPDACGLGGDMLCLVRMPDRAVIAVHGAGAAPFGLIEPASDGGASVTVPGLVHAWERMAERWGRLPLARNLAPAIRLARSGIRMGFRLARSVDEQRGRLQRGGAESWRVFTARPGDVVVQLELANLLDGIAKGRARAFYTGDIAEAMCRAAAASGGAMTTADLAAHRTLFPDPVDTGWRGLRVIVQPPPSQGILLSMVLKGLDALGRLAPDQLDHAGIELTDASFLYRDQVANGVALLQEPLCIDLGKAARKGGPRAYLHTAGVAASDRYGLTVSSLVSVFDDFGSGVLVREGGFLLNNRAGSFTDAPNHAAPGKRPVHTLAPIIIETSRGALALSTPGADGQVQALLQVLCAMFIEGHDLAKAVSRPRWRSEDGRLLIEAGHPSVQRLQAFGHDVQVLEAGHMKFGAVVCAGQIDNAPVCVADWRREAWSGVS